MTQIDSCTRAGRIRALNDAFRETFVGGTVLLTDGVAALDALTRRTLLEAVRSFERVDAGDDPYGEHDFGSIEIKGERFFFKIEAYDRSMTVHSPDATNPAVTSRIITIMRADEY